MDICVASYLRHHSIGRCGSRGTTLGRAMYMLNHVTTLADMPMRERDMVDVLKHFTFPDDSRPTVAEKTTAFLIGNARSDGAVRVRHRRSTRALMLVLDDGEVFETMVNAPHMLVTQYAIAIEHGDRMIAKRLADMEGLRVTGP
jgi:hypothetical protein